MAGLANGPAVYLLGRQVVDAEELGRFLEAEGVSWTTDSEVGAEVLVEAAGRLCYMSYAAPRPGGNRAYVDNLLSSGHHSCLEHAVWNLLVTGVSRSCSHELVRHRHLSPSQLSQRYVDESDALFVVPPDLEEEVRMAREGASGPAAAAGAAWLAHVEASRELYARLTEYLAEKYWQQRTATCGISQDAVEPARVAAGRVARTEARKFARQTARSVLPNATETKLFLTGNARALRHFLGLRASRHADVEIRRLANAVWGVLATESPAMFGDYRRVDLPDGTFELTTENPPT